MSLARTISRGARLKLRLGVNGSQYDSRSLGAGAAAGRVWAISISDLADTIGGGRILFVAGFRCSCYPRAITTYRARAARMAEKAEKSNKLKPRLPRGLADRSPGEIAATRQMLDKIRAVYELYGFEPVETP